MDSQIVQNKHNIEQEFINNGELSKFNKAIEDIDDELQMYSDSEDEEDKEETSSSTNHKFSQISSTQKQSSKKQTSLSIRSVNSCELQIPQEFLKIRDDMQKSFKAPETKLVSLQSNQLAKGDPMVTQIMKIDLLDDIQELKMQLQEEKVNLDYLPFIDTNSEISTLKNIKHILIRKIRRIQSNSIIEDVVYMGLKGVESVFDGKTDILGVKPNLKGLSKSISLKLKNSKHQFTDVIESQCTKYGIGSNSKLVAQIVISAIKRSVINTSSNDTEDYSQQMQTLQQMYRQ